MALDSYAALKTSILGWLARPGDPLVEPTVGDMIRLFEREASRRLKVAGAEKRASLTALGAAVLLPDDFGELRLATSGGVNLTYVTPMQLSGNQGLPGHYTIVGNELRLGPHPTSECTIEIVYQSGVPPLGDSNPSNWLLAQHPDCYLFGSLVEAEGFIGHDERIQLWLVRRDAVFQSIENADRKSRWNGSPLLIRADGISGGGGSAGAGDWTSAPPVPIPIASVFAGNGLEGGGSSGNVTISLDDPVSVLNGGTGASNAAGARTNLGAAPLAGPIFTGNPQAPTPTAGDNDTSIATTAFVQAAVTTAPAVLPVAASGQILGNTAVTDAVVAPAGLSLIQDLTFGSTRGSVLYRAAGSWMALAPGTAGQALLTGGGGANPAWGTPPAANLPINFVVTAEQAMTNLEELARFIPPACSFPAGGSGSLGTAGTAATGSTTLTAAKNGSAFATFAWAGAGTAATVTLSSATSFNGTSDILTVTGPATADASLAKIGITLAGTRT